MRKAKLIVEETVKYQREIKVSVPDEMSDTDLERALSLAEREDRMDDFLLELERYGVVLEEPYDDDLNSPDQFEVECLEYDFLEGQEDA